MDTQVKLLGKVRPTTDGEHDRSRGYDYLCIVYSSQRNTSYISRRAVPEGIDIDNRTYWQPFGNGKFVSNAIINLSDFDGNSRTLVRYTFDEAVREVHPEDRRLGAILTFYETTADKLESPAWAMYQFNSDDISDWYNKECWIPIYYNKNKFAGWFDTEEDLLAAQPFPHVGDYAFVGSSFADAVVYRCFEDGTWTNTGERATGGVLNVVLTGAVSISPNGTWVIDGVDTGISATGPKGDPGTAAGFGNTTAEISYDNTLIQPTVDVRSSGPNNRKDFHFTFKFPRQSSGGGGGNQGGGPGVYVITANNVGEVTYKTNYESEADTYRGEDACGVLVFMGANEPGDLQRYLNARYQGVPIGTKVIIRSHMYDRGHGKSMGNDNTYYYIVENVTEDGHAISPVESYKRNIRNVLGTYNKTSWYSLYSVTKVSNDTWAGLDWVGRVYPNDWTDSGDESQVDPDTLYTLTIIPSVENAEVYVNGELLGVGTVTKDLPAGSVVSIRCAKAGYQEYNDSIVMPANNYTYNANMVEDVSTQYCTIRLVSVKDNLGNSLANRVTVYYRYPGQPETQISVGESFLVPYGTRYDIDVDAPYGQNPDNYWSGTIMNSVLADGDRDLNLVLERENLARVIVGDGNVAVEDLDGLYQNDTKMPSTDAGIQFIYPEGANLRLIAVKDGYKSAILLDTNNLVGDSTKNVNMSAASGNYLDVIPLKVSDTYSDAEYQSYNWQGNILKIKAAVIDNIRRAQILIDSNDSFNVRVSQDFDLGSCYMAAINKPKTQVWYLNDGGNTNPVDGVYAEFEIQQGNNIIIVQLI